MTFVLARADDPDFSYGGEVLKSLHFMMTCHNLADRPGRWRLGQVFVRDETSARIVYEAPDIDEVPSLISELTTALNEGADVHPIVNAAMAHLNLAMIHPFKDGNGRMSRCLQSLVLAREGILSPVFSSIEEYLGENTKDYYRVLAQTGGRAWSPGRDARRWLRFALNAHLSQATTNLRRIKESEQLWGFIETLVAQKGLPERTIPALWDAAMGMRVRNVSYRAAVEEPISDVVAGRDLLRLADAGLLEPHGEKRGRYYLATPRLAELRIQAIDEASR